MTAKLPTLPEGTGWDPAGLVLRQAHDREMANWHGCINCPGKKCPKCGGQRMWREDE